MRFFLAIGVLAFSSAPLSADGPTVAHELNQFNRFFGIGWSDGYHACRQAPRGWGADGPPTPAWLRQRWTAPRNHWAMQPGGAPEVAPLLAPENNSGSAAAERSPYAGVRRPPVPAAILEEIRRYQTRQEEDNWFDNRTEPGELEPDEQSDAGPRLEGGGASQGGAANEPLTAPEQSDFTRRRPAASSPDQHSALASSARRPRAVVREPGGPRRLIREHDVRRRETAHRPPPQATAPPHDDTMPRTPDDPLAWIVEPRDAGPPQPPMSRPAMPRLDKTKHPGGASFRSSPLRAAGNAGQNTPRRIDPSHSF